MARYFLLGGCDLEMLEIKKLLQQKEEKFYDKHLDWGAKLSDYQEYFNDKDEFIGIEIEENIALPKHYKSIDHHGKESYKNSSLEQIAELLDISLSRWQQLVAANDSRYISGLKELCASSQEIKEVRQADRKAQGITQEDEKLAQDSLAISDNTYIIYSKTPHFSAVTDRIYDKFTHYIVYNENKVIFYGFNIKNLLLFLEKKQVLPNDYYYGGGEFGFLGIKENLLNSEEITKLLEDFKKMQEDMKKIISYHTFMLPFTFKESFQKKENWIYKPFQIEDEESYNEYLYFYKHVQAALFNKKEENSSFSNYYEYKVQSGKYIIETNNAIYELEVDGVSLRTFQTGVAILSFNLINREYEKKEDILAINDYGRRIYPPFLDVQRGLSGTQDSVLARAITLELDSEEKIEENFSRFKTVKEDMIQNLLPSFIEKLIKENFNQQSIKPIIDDRMFVISQYNNDALGRELQKFNDTKEIYAYEESDFWYKYVFVDGNGKTCQSKHMTKKLIAESSYDRWIEWGTLFGISRYSFVALSGGDFGQTTLNAHIRTLYFQMFTLLLAYRASIIKFSDDIQATTNAKNEIAKKTRELYKKYLDFLNKLYFKEVTAQDQGIELYNKAMQVMDIPKYMHDLDNEMNELHAYVDMVEEKKRNSKLDNIQLYGGVLLGASVLTGIFGMNVGKDGNFSWCVVIPSIAAVTYLGYKNFLKKEHHE